MPLFCEEFANPALRPVLIVLTHLGWDFVVTRPHHLLSRSLADFDIWFVEEPVIEGSIAMVRESERPATTSFRITIAQPMLPVGTSAANALAHQRDCRPAGGTGLIGAGLHVVSCADGVGLRAASIR